MERCPYVCYWALYLTTFSSAEILKNRMIQDDWLIGKGLEGSGRGLL
jgi:hypothetical protein